MGLAVPKEIDIKDPPGNGHNLVSQAYSLVGLVAADATEAYKEKLVDMLLDQQQAEVSMEASMLGTIKHLDDGEFP